MRREGVIRLPKIFSSQYSSDIYFGNYFEMSLQRQLEDPSRWNSLSRYPRKATRVYADIQMRSLATRYKEIKNFIARGTREYRAGVPKYLISGTHKTVLAE